MAVGLEMYWEFCPHGFSNSLQSCLSDMYKLKIEIDGLGKKGLCSKLNMAYHHDVPVYNALYFIDLCSFTTQIRHLASVFRSSLHHPGWRHGTGTAQCCGRSNQWMEDQELQGHTVRSATGGIGWYMMGVAPSQDSSDHQDSYIQ